MTFRNRAVAMGR